MPSKVGGELVNGASSVAAKLPNGNIVVTYRNGSNAYVQVVNGNGEFSANAIPLGTSITDVEILPNSNFVVVYQLLNGASYAQVVDSSGALIASPNQAVTFVTTLSNGNFVVAYGNAANPYVQVIDPNGVPLGGPAQGVFQTLLSGGNFVILYASGPNYYAQVITASGLFTGGPIQAVLGTSWETVTSLPNGNFVVAYVNASNYYAQLVAGNGTLVGSPMPCGSSLKSILVLINGNLVLGYDSLTTYPSADIFDPSGLGLIRRNPSPNALGLIRLINLSTQRFLMILTTNFGSFVGAQLVNVNSGSFGSLFSTNSASITALPNGNFIHYIPNGSNYNVFFVNATTGAQITLATNAISSIYNVILPNSNFIFVLQNGATYSLQYFNGNGAAASAAISATAKPTVTNLPNGGCLLAYTNGSNSYLQIFNANGAFVGNPIPFGSSIGSVTLLPNPNFFAVTYQAGLNYYAQIVNVTGGLVGSPIQATANPSVTVLPNGNTLFLSQTATGNYGQLFGNDTLPVASPFPVASATGSTILPLLSDYFILNWQTPDTNTHLQIFYAGPNLMVVNGNQTLNYLQDTPQANFSKISILTEYNQANATLTLSDPQAGVLTTPTWGNSQATFASQQGVWQVSGDVNDVNAVLNATQFIPTPNYLGNFTIDLAVGDEGNRTENGLLEWTGVPTPPILRTNALNTTEGQSVILNQNNINVVPSTRPTTITVSNLQGGYFALVSNPNQAIVQFTQQQITAQEVQFVSDRTAAVSYSLSVTDGRFVLPPVSANVVFTNNAPVVVNVPPTQVVDVDKPFRFVLSANQTFNDSDGDPLTFSAQSVDNSPLPSWLNFNASEPDQLAFSGNPTSLGSSRLSLFARDPLNATARTDFDLVVVANNSSNTSINNVNSLSSIMGPVGASIATAFLAASGFFMWRCVTNKNSRKNDLLAAYVRDTLKLEGVDNFYTGKGRRYVSAIKSITDNLHLNSGIDVSSMKDHELQDLADEIADSARNKITTRTYCFKSAITVTDLENKAQEIAAEVAGNRGNAKNYDRVSTV